MLREIPNSVHSLRARTDGPDHMPELIASSRVTMISIGGALPQNMRLAHDVYVLAMQEDGEVVVSEPKFHIHGYGTTLGEAERDFRQVLVDSYELLQEDPQVLDAYLQAQLSYLQSIIIPV